MNDIKEIHDYIKNNSETWFVDLSNMVIQGKQDILEESMDEDVDVDKLISKIKNVVFDYVEQEIIKKAPTDFYWV